MPSFPMVEHDVIELTSFATYQGQRVLNVFHYEYFLAPPVLDAAPDLYAMMADFQNRVIAPAMNGWRDFITSDFSFDYQRAQIVYPTRAPYVQNTTALLAGSLAPPSVPSDTNLTIDFRTLAVGSGLTGNKKFTGLQATAVQGNLWDPAITGGIVAAATPLFVLNLKNAAAADAFRPIVWSKKRAADRRAIWSVNPMPEVRVLRRREFGKGV